MKYIESLDLVKEFVKKIEVIVIPLVVISMDKVT